MIFIIECLTMLTALAAGILADRRNRAVWFAALCERLYGGRLFAHQLGRAEQLAVEPGPA